MIGADYCHDQYPGADFVPEAVVEANSTEEVSALMNLCSEQGISVTVRGAGTGQVGGSVPVKGGIVLSLAGMKNILGFEDGVLRVQPGVLLQDVKAEAERNGMYYPPRPGRADRHHRRQCLNQCRRPLRGEVRQDPGLCCRCSNRPRRRYCYHPCRQRIRHRQRGRYGRGLRCYDRNAQGLNHG